MAVRAESRYTVAVGGVPGVSIARSRESVSTPRRCRISVAVVGVCLVMDKRKIGFRRVGMVVFGSFLLVALTSHLAAQEPLWCDYPAPTESPQQGKKIVLISGDEEYRSEEALPMLGQILARRHGFDCRVLFAINPQDGTIDPNCQQNIPGMEALASADLVVMALRFRQLPDEQMKYFDEYLRAGKPILGLRTSTHAFRYPADCESPFARYSFDSATWPGGFGKQVLGETWISHHGHHKKESTRGVIEPAQRAHPILRGVTDVWGPTDVYGIGNLPEGCEVLLRGQVLVGMDPSDTPVVGEKNDPMMPLAWVRNYQVSDDRSARIFCTTLGASQDFLSEGSRRLVVNACYWCLGLEAKIEPGSNVDFVSEYSPTPYGFDSFVPDRRPRDHAWK